MLDLKSADGKYMATECGRLWDALVPRCTDGVNKRAAGDKVAMSSWVISLFHPASKSQDIYVKKVDKMMTQSSRIFSPGRYWVR